MVMTGNGPIRTLHTPGGRLFTAVDTLAGEAVYVFVVAVLLNSRRAILGRHTVA